MQIGPCAGTLAAESQLSDLYARRKLIHIEKLTFPYRSVHRDTTRHKYRTLMNKTCRVQGQEEGPQQAHARNHSLTGPEIE
jgi:hypothetical protein